MRHPQLYYRIVHILHLHLITILHLMSEFGWRWGGRVEVGATKDPAAATTVTLRWLDVSFSSPPLLKENESIPIVRA